MISARGKSDGKRCSSFFFFTYGFPGVTVPFIKKTGQKFELSFLWFLRSSSYHVLPCTMFMYIFNPLLDPKLFDWLLFIPCSPLPWTYYAFTDYPWTDYLNARWNKNHSELANSCFHLPKKEIVFLFMVPMCLELWPTEQQPKVTCPIFTIEFHTISLLI